MKRDTKNGIRFLTGVAAIFALLCVAGTLDYRDEVISSMSEEAYNGVVNKVGNDDADIVREYMANRAYYDSLN